MYINAKTTNDAWKRILNLIWYSGYELKSERGMTKEIHNLMVKVQEPFDKNIDGFPMSQEELKKYSLQLLDSDRHGFEYTYGERLRKWGSEIVEKPIDQIDYVAKKLKLNKNSRRAIAVTWIPSVDTTKTEVPCLILTDFIIREKKLHLTAVFRSNDMFGAWPANVYGLNNLNQYVAKKLKIKSGSITTLSISAHIYEHDWKNVRGILGI